MKRNKKLAILIVLVTAVIFVWIPKGKKPTAVSANISSAAFDQPIPVTRVVPRKRTEFVGWPRDPFAKPKKEKKEKEKKVSSVSSLKLSCIMWGEKPSAFINESIVCVGDKVTDKTVKQIEQNRVILTDGKNEYVLELK